MQHHVFNSFIKNANLSKEEDTVCMEWEFGNINLQVFFSGNDLETKLDLSEEQDEEIYVMLNQYNEENENEQVDVSSQGFSYEDYAHFESLIHA